MLVQLPNACGHCAQGHAGPNLVLHALHGVLLIWDIQERCHALGDRQDPDAL